MRGRRQNVFKKTKKLWPSHVIMDSWSDVPAGVQVSCVQCFQWLFTRFGALPAAAAYAAAFSLIFATLLPA